VTDPNTIPDERFSLLCCHPGALPFSLRTKTALLTRSCQCSSKTCCGTTLNGEIHPLGPSWASEASAAQFIITFPSRRATDARLTSRSVRRYFSKLAPECQPQLSSEFVSLGRGPLVDSPRLIEPEPFQLVAEDCVQLAPNVVAYGSTGW